MDLVVLPTDEVVAMSIDGDWDHVAALTDITSSQDDTRPSMLFVTL